MRVILASLKGFEVVDTRTVRAHLTRPHAPFLADMALFATSIYPKKLFDQMGKKLWQQPIGTGPFKFQQWKRGSEVILTMAALSYLGRGSQPPTPDWGDIINDGQTLIYTSWRISTFAGLAVMITGLAFSLLGDSLADALESPR